MTGGNSVMKCMEFADSPGKWWRWVRKTARYTIPFSYAVQFVFMFFMCIAAFVGAGAIGLCWTFPKFLREYYSEELTWGI